MINRQRCFIDCIQVLDPDLRERLTDAILAAIHAHLETLPPDERMKPPRLPAPRQTDERPAAIASAEPQNGTVHANPAPPAAVKPKPPGTVSAKPLAEKPKLLPPVRLLANFLRRTL
jgi:hypothetical protein